ncbi:MAG: GAF domain-containing protein, partial [Gammaproteobacteria bacterium]|nr:GAF domain-containing protein [Gammaproteobacteria bacterium]
MSEHSIAKSQDINYRLNRIIMVQSRLVSSNFNLDAFMDLIVHQMQDLTPATGVVIELVDGKEMVYRAATGTVASHIGMRLAIGNSISGLCVNSHKILSSNDTENDERVNKEACRKVGARSLVVTPLFHQGNAIGVLKILSNIPNAFSETDFQTLQLMAGFIGSALAHQMLYEHNQKLLIERTHTLTELEKAQKRLQHLAEY